MNCVTQFASPCATSKGWTSGRTGSSPQPISRPFPERVRSSSSVNTPRVLDVSRTNAAFQAECEDERNDQPEGKCAKHNGRSVPWLRLDQSLRGVEHGDD